MAEFLIKVNQANLARRTGHGIWEVNYVEHVCLAEHGRDNFVKRPNSGAVFVNVNLEFKMAGSGSFPVP